MKYFLVYKEQSGASRKIDGFRIGRRRKSLENIDGVETFADLMGRPAMPVKEVRFKGWSLSKSPSASNMEDLDEEGKMSGTDESFAETMSGMKVGGSMHDYKRRGSVSSKSKDRMSLHKRFKDISSTRKMGRTASTHGRVEGHGSAHGSSHGSSHGRVKISPSGHSRIPVSTVAFDDPSKPQSCLAVKTLSESLNACCKMEPTTKPPILSSDHSRTTKSGSSIKSSVGVGNNGGLKFGNIEIRQYTRVLGDNPACPAGPPISLGWKYSPKSIVVSVDVYETGREPRRKDATLRLSVKRRETILRALGYSTRDLIEADRIRKKDQILRERTVSRIRFSHFDETVENAKRFAHFKKKKK